MFGLLVAGARNHLRANRFPAIAIARGRAPWWCCSRVSITTCQFRLLRERGDEYHALVVLARQKSARMKLVPVFRDRHQPESREDSA
jgi:hypothetical protein